MKYTHNENTYFNGGKSSPRPWLTSVFDDPIHIMGEFFRNELELYDADNGGDDEYIFAFDNGDFYKLTHDWWITYNPEWEIHNTYFYEKIDITKVPSWMQKYRDWI